MIKFNEEIKRFKPSLEIDNIEENVKENNVEDLLDILQHVIKEKQIKDKE